MPETTAASAFRYSPKTRPKIGTKARKPALSLRIYYRRRRFLGRQSVLCFKSCSEKQPGMPLHTTDRCDEETSGRRLQTPVAASHEDGRIGEGEGGTFVRREKPLMNRDLSRQGKPSKKGS